MSAKPIALLLPARNRQVKLERALQSLLPEADLLKVVVIDDGSEPPLRIPDGLAIDSILIRLPSHQGISRALNAGLECAFDLGTPFVARLDSDDTAIAGRFGKQLAYMERHPEVGICGTGYEECDPDGHTLGTVILPNDDAGIRRMMHLRTALWHPTVMLRASVARAVGPFDSSLLCEDLDYFTRVLERTRGANLPEALVRYEVGAADALTGTASRRRALAISILKLKLRRRELTQPLWWIGMLATTSYLIGLNRILRPLTNPAMRLLEWRGG